MANDDYIERKVVSIILKGNISPCMFRDKLLEQINSIPPAEVEPKRKIAYWIDENPDSYLDPRMRCSVCGHVDLPIVKWNFCPVCGAKIDKIK